MPDLDLRALIQQRKADGARGTVKCKVCLDPDLLPMLDELADAAPDEDDKRLAGPKVAAHRKQIAELQKRVDELTVVVVFSVPSRAQKVSYEQAVKDEEDVDPRIVSECFLRFEKDGQPLTDIGRNDWLDLLEVTPPGEINAMANVVYRRAVVAPDFPT
jgi:hypothetical protein